MASKNKLVEALKKNFGFDTFKGNQEAIIRNLLNGKDTFVLMPTGGGKSLCYQLPSLMLDGTAIVISPPRHPAAAGAEAWAGASRRVAGAEGRNLSLYTRCSGRSFSSVPESGSE